MARRELLIETDYVEAVRAWLLFCLVVFRLCLGVSIGFFVFSASNFVIFDLCYAGVSASIQGSCRSVPSRSAFCRYAAHPSAFCLFLFCLFSCLLWLLAYTFVDLLTLLCVSVCLSVCPARAVPTVHSDLTTKRVLTTDLVSGVPVDKCLSMPQATRDFVRCLCSRSGCLFVLACVVVCFLLPSCMHCDNHETNKKIAAV